MGSTPRVSVIIGVYNAEPYLDQTIRSVVEQTYRDWELIIVDDGSTDQTAAIADRWAAREPRIRVIHQPNSGLPAIPRNRGMLEACGDIITFLDGDDLYLPERLARSMAVLDAWPEVGSVFHDYRWFEDGSDPAQGRAYLAEESFVKRAAHALTARSVEGRQVWVGNGDLIKFMSTEIVGIHTSTISVRRTVLDRLDPPGFRDDIPHCEDIDLWLRISEATTSTVLPETLSYYRHTATGVMGSRPLGKLVRGSFVVKSEMLERLERSLRPEEWAAYRDRVSHCWSGVAYMCLTSGLASEARYGYRQAWRTGSERSAIRRAIKGTVVSRLPRPILHAWWRLTGGGYRGRSKGR